MWRIEHYISYFTYRLSWLAIQDTATRGYTTLAASRANCTQQVDVATLGVRRRHPPPPPLLLPHLRAAS
ncbi:hypothetical protein J6590_030548, partial [Homalodisca vitripennis]